MDKPLTDILQSALMSRHRIWRLLAIVGFCLLVGGIAGAILALLAPMYTAAFAIALIAAILMLRDIRWGFIGLVAIICLLPFAAVPLGVGFEPTFLDLVLAAVFFVWASRIATRRQGPFLVSPLGAPILLFMVILMAALIAGLGHSSLNTTLLRHFAELLLGIATFFAVINCVRTRQQVELLVKALIVAGFLASFIGIVLYVMPQNLSIRILSMLRVVRYPSGAGVLRYVEDSVDLPLRAISTSQDPNVLGGLLILVTGLTIPQVISAKPLLPRKFMVPMAASMLLCLILTYSRGSLGGLAVGIGVISILRYRKLGWLILAGAALMALLPQTQTYIQHLVEGVMGQDLATQMRFGEYSDAAKVVLNHPWLGVGFSGTPEIYLYVGVSNVYLLIAEEAGLIGLAVFLLILVLFFVQLWRAAQSVRRKGLEPGQPSTLEPIIWGIWAATMGGLAAGMLDHYLFNLDFPHAVTLFWTYLGLGIVASRLAKAAESTA